MDELFKFLLRFFHSWRQLIGVWTLLAACLFAAGWGRSFFYIDRVICPMSKSQGVYSTSVRGHIAVSTLKQNFENAGMMPWLETIPVSTLSESHDSGVDRFLDPVRVFSGLETLYYGFGFSLEKRWIALLPYWSIVIPLTLLSAYLLLSKPRRPRQKNLTEPVPTGGA